MGSCNSSEGWPALRRAFVTDFQSAVYASESNFTSSALLQGHLGHRMRVSDPHFARAGLEQQCVQDMLATWYRLIHDEMTRRQTAGQHVVAQLIAACIAACSCRCATQERSHKKC